MKYAVGSLPEGFVSDYTLTGSSISWYGQSTGTFVWQMRTIHFRCPVEFTTVYTRSQRSITGRNAMPSAASAMALASPQAVSTAGTI